jgi:hypothetical protein
MTSEPRAATILVTSSELVCLVFPRSIFEVSDVRSLSRAFSPPSLHPLFTLSSPSLHTLSTLSPPSLHSLSTLSSPSLQPLSPLSPHPLHPNSTFSPPSLHPHSTFSPPSLHLLSPLSPPSLHPLSPLSPPSRRQSIISGSEALLGDDTNVNVDWSKDNETRSLFRHIENIVSIVKATNASLSPKMKRVLYELMTVFTPELSPDEVISRMVMTVKVRSAPAARCGGFCFLHCHEGWS